MWTEEEKNPNKHETIQLTAFYETKRIENVYTVCTPAHGLQSPNSRNEQSEEEEEETPISSAHVYTRLIVDYARL